MDEPDIFLSLFSGAEVCDAAGAQEVQLRGRRFAKRTSPTSGTAVRVAQPFPPTGGAFTCLASSLLNSCSTGAPELRRLQIRPAHHGVPPEAVSLLSFLIVRAR